MNNKQQEPTLPENNTFTPDTGDPPLKFSTKAKLKIILFSLFGFFTYFVSFKLTETGSPTILVDHIANIIKGFLGTTLVAWICVIAMIAGAIQPFYFS